MGLTSPPQINEPLRLAGCKSLLEHRESFCNIYSSVKYATFAKMSLVFSHHATLI
jgi:hypothetical protein